MPEEPEITFFVERLDDDLEIVREGQVKQSARVRYALTSTADGTLAGAVSSEPEEAYQWALANLPATFAGIPRTRLSYDEVVDNCQHIFMLEFETPSNDRRDDGTLINPYVSVDTTGKSERIYYSLKTVTNPPIMHPDFGGGGGPRDFMGAINVGDGGPDGVDIIAHHFSWSEKWYFNASTVSWQYLASLGQLSGTTNKSTFRGFPAGDVLFVGAQFVPDDSDRTIHTVTFYFQHNRGGEDEWVKGFPAFPKKGWEYMWVYSVGEHDTATGTSAKSPRQLQVEQVYFDAELHTVLGIGADLPATANIALTGGMPTPAS